MSGFQSLLRLTLTNPGEAARWLVAQQWPRRELWQAVLALSALGAILTWFSLQLAPLPAGFPDFVAMPLPNFVVEVFGTALMVFALLWSGRAMGGQGQLDDVLTIMVWMMVMRLIFKAAGIVLLALVPPLAGLFMLATGILSFWIMLHLVSQAHRLGSVWRALGALLLAVVGISIALGVVLGFLGFGVTGVAGNV